MHQYVNKVVCGTLALGLAASAAACGRSENVGWADREAPDSLALLAESPELPEIEFDREEYMQLSESLTGVQMAVFADSQVMEKWSALVNEVDEKILMQSAFHRSLLERLEEIDSLVSASEQAGPDSLTTQQMTELAQHHRNIQLEMARARSEVFRTPQYATRYLALQEEVYDYMRRLYPERAAEIDRLQAMERHYFMNPQETVPAGPAIRPQR